MAIKKTIGFYHTNTPIEEQVFEGESYLDVDIAINEFIQANKDNIQGWNTPTKGVRSEKVETV
tara:strand:+ start:315 stop:503 length:189 start_codon:yes stop_codon:yes gene_type:complete